MSDGARFVTGQVLSVRWRLERERRTDSSRMSDYLIGIDLGGTRIKAVAVTPQGHEYSRAHESTDDSEGDMAWRGKVQSLVAGFANQFGTPAAIGLSAPGLAAHDAKSISYMPGSFARSGELRLERLLESVGASTQRCARRAAW
jgi:predicted NBD/HSP70 family sugar kinase